MSKEKNQSVRHNLSTSSSNTDFKQTSLKFMPGITVPKLVLHPKLIQFINSVDIGNVKDLIAYFCYDLD
jgi:hypothetical protein